MKGLDRFREYFAGHEAQYVLIGGAACDVLMREQGLLFRATKDLDVVLCVEALDPAFARRFWAFIEAGGYENRQKGEAKQFYRFDKPAAEDFPFQVELFSRQPQGVTLEGEPHLTPIAIGEGRRQPFGHPARCALLRGPAGQCTRRRRGADLGREPADPVQGPGLSRPGGAARGRR
jgi:hypothetical protein